MNMEELRAKWREERRCWPDRLVDEYMPDGKIKPEDWLTPDADGVTHQFVAGDEKFNFEVRPGDTITFYWQEPRGFLTIELDGVSDFTIIEPDRCARTPDLWQDTAPPPPKHDYLTSVPDDANFFYDVTDHENQSGSLEEFVEFNNEYLDRQTGSATVRMASCRWEQFVVEADGKTLRPKDECKVAS